MAALVDQDVGLGEEEVRRRGGDWSSKSYPLQISMYHRLTVHVYQPPCNVFELSEQIINGRHHWQRRILQVRTDSHSYVP